MAGYLGPFSLEPSSALTVLVDPPEDEANLPDPIASVDPQRLEPMCDAYTEHYIFQWYRLVNEGLDLAPEEFGDRSIGRPPKWLQWEEDMSLETLLALHFTEQRWVKWALEEGLAPGQPFLVCIHKPTYSGSGCNYWGENDIDVEWDVRVVRSLPRSPEQAARSWARVLDQFKAYDAWVERKQAALRRVQDQSWRSFELNLCSRVDEFDDDRTLRIQLTTPFSSWHSPTRRGHRVAIASGSSKKGCKREAVLNLIENLKRDRPNVPIAPVVNLLDTNTLTRWDHLRLETV